MLKLSCTCLIDTVFCVTCRLHIQGKHVRTFLVHSPYKKVVKSLCYENPSYTARSMLHVPLLKQSTLAEMTKVCTSYNGYSFWIKLFLYRL